MAPKLTPAMLTTYEAFLVAAEDLVQAKLRVGAIGPLELARCNKAVTEAFAALRAPVPIGVAAWLRPS